MFPRQAARRIVYRFTEPLSQALPAVSDGRRKGHEAGGVRRLPVHGAPRSALVVEADVRGQLGSCLGIATGQGLVVKVLASRQASTLLAYLSIAANR